MWVLVSRMPKQEKQNGNMRNIDARSVGGCAVYDPMRGALSESKMLVRLVRLKRPYTALPIQKVDKMAKTRADQ